MVGGIALTAASPAMGLSLIINATAAGWFGDDGTHNAANGNYLSGWDGTEEFRDFFLFDLSSVSGVVTAVTLRVNSGQVLTPDPSETIAFYEVTTPPADLQVNQSGRTDIFADLGDGAMYGSAVMASTLYYTNVDVPLNSAAVGAINGALGGMFGLGGTVTTLSKPPFDNEDVFANTSNLLSRQLVITDVGCTTAPLSR